MRRFQQTGSLRKESKESISTETTRIKPPDWRDRPTMFFLLTTWSTYTNMFFLLTHYWCSRGICRNLHKKYCTERFLVAWSASRRSVPDFAASSIPICLVVPSTMGSLGSRLPRSRIHRIRQKTASGSTKERKTEEAYSLSSIKASTIVD
jgi:hypothetical protein